MAKLFKKDGKVYGANGSYITNINSEDKNRKYYAVIAKCGHCGDGYYIPIMFPVHCAKEDIQANVMTIPRIKRDKSDFILQSFEVSDIEYYLIKVLDDHDPYVKGYHMKGSEEIDSRKVLQRNTLDVVLKERSGLARNVKFDFEQIKTADMYEDGMVLERYFAPYRQGDDLIFPKKVNSRQLLDEFFYYKCKTVGIKKGRIGVMTLYYQIYGKNNALGFKIKDGKLCYKDERGVAHELPIPPSQMEKLQPVLDREKAEVQESAAEKPRFENGSNNTPSAIEKFNRRFKKFKALTESASKKKSQGDMGESGKNESGSGEYGAN